MKKSIFFLIAVSALGQVPAVLPGSVTVDFISHGSARVKWQPVPTSSTVGPWIYWRLRTIASPGTCESGTGGFVSTGDNSNKLQNYSTVAGGLDPNTTYDVCPEGSSDNQNWSSGVGATFTTASLSSTSHPALPIPPTRFNTDYPDTTGYTVVDVPSNDDCSGLRDAINAAVSQLNTTGTIINLPAGSVCTGKLRPSAFAPDVVTLSPSAFDVSTHTITSPNHGFQEGAQIVWSLHTYQFNASCLPGQTNCDVTQGPIIIGHPYFVHVIDTNRFQVYYNAPYGSTCQGDQYESNTCPHLWSFSDQGRGNILYAPWPRKLKWIIVRTSTPDAQFVPEHVRVNPNWAPLMAKIQAPNSLLGSGGYASYMFNTATGDVGEVADRFLLSNIRFTGIEFTYQPYPQAATTADPPPGQPLIVTSTDSQNIIFDRCYIHGYPTPFRAYRVFTWDGMNVAIVDSDIRDMHLFRAYHLGLDTHQ